MNIHRRKYLKKYLCLELTKNMMLFNESPLNVSEIAYNQCQRLKQLSFKASKCIHAHNYTYVPCKISLPGMLHGT